MPAIRPLSQAESAESQNRTGDTMIFSHVLYQLSYLGLSSGILPKASLFYTDVIPLSSAARSQSALKKLLFAVPVRFLNRVRGISETPYPWFATCGAGVQLAPEQPARHPLLR